VHFDPIVLLHLGFSLVPFLSPRGFAPVRPQSVDEPTSAHFEQKSRLPLFHQVL
jgi:hypothetical protein